MTNDARADTPRGAVFLSYASQDSELARKICEALRAAEIEVWFDQSELRGGDTWDRNIRRQIKECALFVPIISANTQARPEGYFRLEWKLAVDRSHLLADDHPFFFPVAIGDIGEAEARVPEKFKEVQWTWVKTGEAPDELAGNLSKLLAGSPDKGGVRGAASRKDTQPVAAKPRSSAAWMWVALAAAAGIGLYAIVRSERGTAGNAAPLSAAPLSEARQLVQKARVLFESPDVTNRENMLLAEQICDKAVALDPADAEVWSARSQLSYTMLSYGHDRSSARLQKITSDAQRALALSPTSYEARFATAEDFTRQPSRSAEAETLYRSLLAENPTDRRVLRSYGQFLRHSGRYDEAFACYDKAAAVPGGDPIALADKANSFYFLGKLPEAEKAVQQSLVQAPTGRAYLIYTLLQLVMHGDKDGARDALARVPQSALLENRSINIATLVWLWRREPEHALEFLHTVPQDFIEDIYFTGPKLLLTGRAQKLAGHDEAARADWEAALRLLDSRGTGMDFDTMVVRCELLARLGRTDEAGKILLQIDQDRGASWRGQTDKAVKLLILLGRTDEAMALLPGLVGSPSNSVIITRYSLRLDPDYDPIRGDARFQALLSEPPLEAAPGPRK